MERLSLSGGFGKTKWGLVGLGVKLNRTVGQIIVATNLHSLVLQAMLRNGHILSFSRLYS